MLMKRFLFLSIAFIALGASLLAQQSTTRYYFAYAYENLTIDNTVGGIAFTSTKVTSTTNPNNAAQLVTFTIACASGTDCPIRFTIDGTVPTTTVGMRALYGSTIEIFNHTSIVAFRAIREGATSAVLNVTYSR